MHPVLLSFEIWNRQIDITAYSLFGVLSAITVTCLGLLVAVNRGLPLRKSKLCFLLMAISFPIGARLLHLASNIDFYTQNPEQLLSLHPAGFALYGGLGLAVISGFISSRLLNIDAWRLADSITPALGIGIGVMRMGCFFNGCCFGKPTTLPWGISFPFGSPAYNYQLEHNINTQGLGVFFQGIQTLPVHPTQFYEMTAAFAGSITAFLLLRRKLPNGVVFLAFALLFTTFRLVNYYLRVPAPTLTVPGWFYPAFYVVLIIICAAVILRILNQASIFSKENAD